MTDEPLPSEPLTLQQVNETVHKIITERTKRFGDMASKLETLSAQLESQLGQFKAPASDATATTAPSVSDPSADRIAQLEKALRAESEKRVAKEREARNMSAYQTLKEKLAPSVRPEALDAAAKLLFKADEMVKVKDHGPEWMDGRDLDAGLADWLSSKDAQLFLPAPTPKANPASHPTSLPSRSTFGNRADRDLDAEAARILRELGPIR